MLASAFDILKPDLPPALFSPELTAGLHERVHVLTPICRLGLECRLGAGAFQVDLQQNIRATDDEKAILKRHIAHLISSASFNHPSLRTIQTFAEAWSDPSSLLYNGVSEVWLEFDFPEDTPHSPVPSIFLGLPKEATSDGRAFDIVDKALALLRGEPLSTPIQHHLKRVVDACEGEAFMSHVGVMLSRQVEALRVNVRRLPRVFTLPYLDCIGWTGPVAELDTILAQLFGFVDSMTLCLDVGAQFYPRLGLECFLLAQPGEDLRWPALLANLVERGLCTPEKKEALLAWPNYKGPTSTPLPWPEAFVVESLLHAPDQFSTLCRHLNHIKLTYQARHLVEAKAYLGFGHVWLTPGTEKEPPPERPQAQSHPVLSKARNTDQESLASAIANGLTFLLSVRNQGGWWRDFPLPPERGGESDAYVTAYVGLVLAGLPDRRAIQAAEQAWARLYEQYKTNGSWGWNLTLTPDADTTAWAVRLGQAIGADARHVEEAYTFISKHIDPNGGIASYIYRGAVHSRAAFALNDNSSVAGWCSPHTCVTAGIAHLKAIGAPARRYLRTVQHHDGKWTGYWCSSHEYTTALAAEALAHTNDDEQDTERVERAVLWAQRQLTPSGAVPSVLHPEGSAFATACAIRVLCLTADFQQVVHPIMQALDWLLDHQRDDGSWAPSTPLRLPPPSVLDPETHQGSLIYLDQRSIFTTATVLAALEAVALRLQSASGLSSSPTDQLLP